MKKKEFKVGEVFQCGLVKLRCEEKRNGCEGCAFYNVDWCEDIYPFAGPCNKEDRYNDDDVIFVKVEDKL